MGKDKPITDKWDGEDEDDDIKDAWDAEDEEKTEDGEQVKAVQVKKKKKLSDRIAEREAAQEAQEEQRRKDLAAKIAAQTPEAKLAEKMRLQKLEENANLQLAKDMLGMNNKILPLKLYFKLIHSVSSIVNLLPLEYLFILHEKGWMYGRYLRKRKITSCHDWGSAKWINDSHNHLAWIIRFNWRLTFNFSTTASF